MVSSKLFQHDGNPFLAVILGQLLPVFNPRSITALPT